MVRKTDTPELEPENPCDPAHAHRARQRPVRPMRDTTADILRAADPVRPDDERPTEEDLDPAPYGRTEIPALEGWRDENLPDGRTRPLNRRNYVKQFPINQFSRRRLTMTVYRTDLSASQQRNVMRRSRGYSRAWRGDEYQPQDNDEPQQDGLQDPTPRTSRPTSPKPAGNDGDAAHDGTGVEVKGDDLPARPASPFKDHTRRLPESGWAHESTRHLEHGLRTGSVNGREPGDQWPHHGGTSAPSLGATGQVIAELDSRLAADVGAPVPDTPHEREDSVSAWTDAVKASGDPESPESTPVPPNDDYLAKRADIAQLYIDSAPLPDSHVLGPPYTGPSLPTPAGRKQPIDPYRNQSAVTEEDDFDSVYGPDPRSEAPRGDDASSVSTSLWTPDHTANEPAFRGPNDSGVPTIHTDRAEPDDGGEEAGASSDRSNRLRSPSNERSSEQPPMTYRGHEAATLRLRADSSSRDHARTTSHESAKSGVSGDSEDFDRTPSHTPILGHVDLRPSFDRRPSLPSRRSSENRPPNYGRSFRP